MRRIYALFALSGTAGLIYEVVWSSLLKQVLGVTVFAVTTVLATFLGGLALGAFWFGRAADRTQRPLRLYGWLEIGIALAAVTGAGLHYALAPMQVLLANRLEAFPATLLLVRFLLCALVILPTTVLMGGTLPVMTRAAVKRLQRLGHDLSLLYALNTLGAVVGCLAAGFLLVRALGLHGTLSVAAALNLVVGLVSLRLSRGLPDPLPEPAPGSTCGTVEPPAAQQTAVLAAIGLSGFVALGLEVTWTRVLVQIIGTTAYAFATMLASFLIGITAGSFIAQRYVDRLGDPRRFFGWLQLGIAASTLATLPLINLGVAQQWLVGHGTDWIDLVAMRFGVSLLVMLVPATLVGMTLPLAVKLWTRDLRHVGSGVGAVYGANTLGNILGTVVSGFVLLPWLGLQHTIVALTALNLVAAAWSFAAPAPRFAARGLRVAAAVAVAGAWLMLWLAWQPAPFKLFGERPGDRVLYYREGVESTVRVIQKADRPDELWMGVDAIMIGQSAGGVDAKQQALAHYPFLLRTRAPRRLLTIGLGTGILAGEVVKHPEVERLDCLEISGPVIEAARVFDRFNDHVLDNDRVRVIHDDGVNYLRRTSERYDVIISDGKSRTTHAANSLFFSSDYYRLATRRLEPDGMMIQWAPLSLPPNELRIILRTFLSVFPHGHVWVSPPHALFLVGGQTPLTLDLAHIDRVLASPAAVHLRRYGLRDAESFVRGLTADGESLTRWLESEQTLNSLEHPVLEYYSPAEHAVLPELREEENLLGLQARDQDPRGRVLRGEALARFENDRRLTAWLGEALDALEGADPARIGSALPLIDRVVRGAAPTSVTGYAAAAAYGLALRLEPGLAGARFDLARLLMQQRRSGDSVREYRRGLELDPQNVEARVDLGLVLLAADRIEAAAGHFERALRLNPDSALALGGMARVLIAHPDLRRRDPRRALELAGRAARLTGERNAWILETLAATRAAVGR